jgi:hypothetical protein
MKCNAQLYWSCLDFFHEDLLRLSRRSRRNRPFAFFSIVHASLHGLCQLLLVLRQQPFNLVMGVVADRVDLRSQSFP